MPRWNKLRECYLRPLAFFGRGPIDLKPKRECDVRVFIAARGLGSFLGENALRNGIRVIGTCNCQQARLRASGSQSRTDSRDVSQSKRITRRNTLAGCPRSRRGSQVAFHHASSSNGIDFIQDKTAIFTREHMDWTKGGINSPSVLFEDGKAKMWFGGHARQDEFIPRLIRNDWKDDGFGIGYGSLDSSLFE